MVTPILLQPISTTIGKYWIAAPSCLSQQYFLKILHSQALCVPYLMRFSQPIRRFLKRVGIYLQLSFLFKYHFLTLLEVVILTCPLNFIIGHTISIQGLHKLKRRHCDSNAGYQKVGYLSRVLRCLYSISANW